MHSSEPLPVRLEWFGDALERKVNGEIVKIQRVCTPAGEELAGLASRVESDVLALARSHFGYLPAAQAISP